jgi:uncharacterized protein (DUF2141 family)
MKPFLIALIALAPAAAWAQTVPSTPAAPKAQKTAAQSTTVAVPAPTTATITVIIDKVESDKGNVVVGLCNRGLTPDGCDMTLKTPAAVGEVSVTFENVKPGRWAVAAFQDENSSGDMDTLFKVPREPYALSNDAASEVVPTLKDALVPIKAGDNEVRLSLGRFMSR